MTDHHLSLNKLASISMNDKIQLRFKQALTLGLLTGLSSSIAILALVTYNWQSKRGFSFIMR